MSKQDPGRILLFSTLNPYPYWAGSENFWFDFVTDQRVSDSCQFDIMLADSPATRQKATTITAAGHKAGFYKHFNTHFTKRNLFRVSDKLTGRSLRTLPWYKEINKSKYDLVWFNVAALADLSELSYAVQLCEKKNIPYWLILQHGYEDFFLTTEEEINKVTKVATNARRFIFIADQNRVSLQRAIGCELKNAFRSVNAVSSSKIASGKQLSQAHPVNTSPEARFFNLGRFAPRDKAQHLLLESFAAAQWKSRDWQLNFIGVSGYGRSYLEKLIRYYGLSPERISIMAHTDNVFEEIVKNDVLLMPSISEGTPYAMVESMACGRPALGTPVGGIPELITPGKTGWLAASTHVNAVAEELEKCWKEKDKWQQYGMYAQAFISGNYNQEHSIPALLEVLKADCLDK